jgi:hypothetical protein
MEMVDGAPDGASFSCAGWDLCEDFEGGAIGAAWTVDPTVTVDSTLAHRGTHSARMHMNADAIGQYEAGHIFETATLSPVPNETWVRAYVRLGALPTGTNALELLSIQHAGGGPAGEYTFVRQGLFEIYVAPALATVTTSTSPATNAWYCLIFHVVFSTTNSGSLDLSGDAAAGISGTTTNDSTTPVDSLGVGPYLAGPNVADAQPAFDVWVDDVIVHHTAVTCAD